MIVAVAVELAHYSIIRYRRRREIAHIRKFFTSIEPAVKERCGNNNSMRLDGPTSHEYFKARLQEAEQLAIHSDNLSRGQRVGLMILLDAELEKLSQQPEGFNPGVTYYERFFAKLSGLKWLGI